MPLDKNEYVTNFIRNNYVQISLKFNKEKDRIILKHLSRKENVTEYIRNLIKKDIDKRK